MISRSTAPLLLLGPALLLGIVALLLHPIPQPVSYHNFADHRAWLGIPNFGDVVSNVPFAVLGLLGLVVLFKPGAASLSSTGERWLYTMMFASLILTAK